MLDPDGEPIRGLYGAGELGAPWGFRYQTSRNATEALISGRTAGRHAAARAGRRRFRRSEEAVRESTPSRRTTPF